MKILYTLPGISNPHGGYRIVCEHLTRLKKLGHETALFVENGKIECDWYDLSGITVTGDRSAFKRYDTIVIGSPHSIWVEDHIRPDQKCFLFMQMVEEKFRSNDRSWSLMCRKFYMSRFPIIHGSRWGEEYVRKIGHRGAMHYIGNGVNFNHFPISDKPKDGKTILLESPFSRNPAKDTDRLASKVIFRLKSEGYNIIGYGSDDLDSRYPLDEYIMRPSLEDMNRMYEEASILVKATKWDARALSPVEAMTKGCVTARAIIQGDDDLMHGVNCLRSGYDENELYENSSFLLKNQDYLSLISGACGAYVQLHCNWETIIPQLEKILIS